MKKTLASALIALVVVGGGAVAYAQEEAPPTAPTSESAARAEHHRLRHRTVHGDLIVRTKDGFREVTVDRGRLTSVDGSTLTVTRPDGPVVSFTVNAETRYPGVSSAAELQTGEPVFVVSTDGVAKAVAERK